MQANNSKEDRELIEAAINGDQQSLEALIKRHQDWILNTAINFVADRDEALDIMQEVLIKAITKLSSFQHKSNFRTWLFRITKNHFLNMKRKKHEINQPTFEQFGLGLDMTPDEDLGSYHFEVEEKLLVKEAKYSCMKAMLLCLEREQRLIYIIGELFEMPDSAGSEIMEISKGNFRVKLHRAKQQLYNFMNQKCGLINKKNPCRCARKTAGFIKNGYVDPKRLHFQKEYITSINHSIEHKLDSYSSEVIPSYQQLYQDHPFQQVPKEMSIIKKLLDSDSVKKTFNL